MRKEHEVKFELKQECLDEHMVFNWKKG